MLEDYSCGSPQPSLLQTKQPPFAHLVLFGGVSSSSRRCHCCHLDTHPRLLSCAVLQTGLLLYQSRAECKDCFESLTGYLAARKEKAKSSRQGKIHLIYFQLALGCITCTGDGREITQALHWEKPLGAHPVLFSHKQPHLTAEFAYLPMFGL